MPGVLGPALALLLHSPTAGYPCRGLMIWGQPAKQMECGAGAYPIISRCCLMARPVKTTKQVMCCFQNVNARKCDTMHKLCERKSTAYSFYSKGELLYTLLILIFTCLYLTCIFEKNKIFHICGKTERFKKVKISIPTIH